MTQAFSRYTPRFERTFALRAFNQCETEINEHFWSFKVASEYANNIARKQRRIDAGFSTAVLFHAAGPDSVRIPGTVTKWLTAHRQLENWLRLSALVSAVSYFELYVAQVVRSALMSDPLCRFGSRRALDGTVFLKADREIPFKDEIDAVTKGTWSSRASAFSAIFGDSQIFAGRLSELETIRKIRNEFAHGFGRSTNAPEPSSGARDPSSKISQANLLKKLGVLSETAAEIDNLLLTHFIGNFELIHFYHRWKVTGARTSGLSNTYVNQVKTAFHLEAKCSLGKDFCRELIDFYDRA